MKTMKTLVLTASVLAIGLGASGINNQAHAANQGTSAYVQNVDIDFPGFAGQIHIENDSNNKLLSALDLDVKDSEIEVEIDGFCTMCKRQQGK